MLETWHAGQAGDPRALWGGWYPCDPHGHARPSPPPLEPEAGSTLLNFHIYSDFYFSYQWIMSKFVHFMIFIKFFLVP